MKFTILTLFPEMFVGPFDQSIIKRAKEKHLVEIEFVNIRDFAIDKHKSVDDHPYGGGAGMVMRVDVVDRAIKSVRGERLEVRGKEIVILLDPRGKTYNQEQADVLKTYDHIILLCGHYEGVDERIRSLVDEEVSIGDYVVTGGELPAMMIVDSVTRLIPGAITHTEGTIEESFHDMLEYPQYTRPEEYQGQHVPDVLKNGNHKEIKAWQHQQAEEITQKLRPDLLRKRV